MNGWGSILDKRGPAPRSLLLLPTTADFECENSEEVLSIVVWISGGRAKHI